MDNILRFEKDFPGAKVIRLERNYRSTGHILAAASHLIAHNEGRLGKTLRSESEAGEKVTVTSAWDSEEEARIVGEEIEDLQRGGHSLDEIAILVRASFQMREFEDRFVTMGLPYRVIGGPRFYERAEIRDALAYLRCVNSESDDLAFERIVNVPKRGLGDATIAVLHDHARAARVSLMGATRAIIATDELKPKPRQALRDLIAAFDRWRVKRNSIPHTELAEIVLDESGYTEMWQKDRSADAAGRLENLKELVRSMEEFENLQGFLEHISLVMDVERGLGSTEAVSVMTLHSAKGLEFDTVFLPGWEEGLLPHQRSLDEQGRAGLEEERRLAHVGITRARKRAKIYFVSNRRMRGSWASTVPSRFVERTARAACGGRGIQGKFRRLFRLRQCGRLALRHHGDIWVELPHARLAACPRRPGRRRRRLRGTRGRWKRIERQTWRPARYRCALERYFPQRHCVGGGRARCLHHRGRTGGKIHRHRLGFRARRPGVPPEIRRRPSHPRGRQQAYRRVRPRRREKGGGSFCGAGVRPGELAAGGDHRRDRCRSLTYGRVH